MKFIVLVFVVLVVLWLARTRRPASPATKPPAALPEAMQRCAQCGVHVPTSQSWPGRGGYYCSAEHRSEHEEAISRSGG